MMLVCYDDMYRIGGDDGGVLRAGPLEGDGGVRQQGDGVRHAGAPRVVGPLQPHGGRRRPRRQLVLDVVVGLRRRRRRHEHLRPHLSAAAGWPVAAAGGGVGTTRIVRVTSARLQACVWRATRLDVCTRNG